MAFLSRRVLAGEQPTPVQMEWLQSSYRKICLQVQNEAELDALAAKAKEAGIECHVITDSGLTEFHGVPTKTCLALGPDTDERLAPITDGLALY